MTETWLLAALWLCLALVATLLSIWLRVATALSEIVVGTVAQLIIGATIGTTLLRTDDSWIKFLSGTGAIVLTFLAGAELDPAVFRIKWKEASLIGLVGFVAPFFGCTAIAYWILHWDVRASWLAGVAMSTTSVAIVYAVMLEFGLNVTTYGKTVLGACFINDLLTCSPWGSSSVRSLGKRAPSVVERAYVLPCCPSSRRGSSGATVGDRPNLKPSSFCSCYSRRWRANSWVCIPLPKSFARQRKKLFIRPC
ncbi:MAG TPA: cation:proton antiporter [Steroidobacteraceae bacterium]|jgi:hypothetical protein|nr:cation:proton antiporter [Steroidobacteraceae bacterium]